MAANEIQYSGSTGGALRQRKHYVSAGYIQLIMSVILGHVRAKYENDRVFPLLGARAISRSQIMNTISLYTLLYVKGMGMYEMVLSDLSEEPYKHRSRRWLLPFHGKVPSVHICLDYLTIYPVASHHRAEVKLAQYLPRSL